MAFEDMLTANISVTMIGSSWMFAHAADVPVENYVQTLDLNT